MNYWLKVAEDKYIVSQSATGHIIVKSPYDNYLFFIVDLVEQHDPLTGMRHYFTKVVPHIVAGLYVFQEEKDKALQAAKDFLGIP